MPRQVQVLRTCENHPEVEAGDEIPPVTWGVGTPRLFDACEECMRTIVEPFMALMALGQEVAPPVRVGRPATTQAACPLEDCDYVGPNRKALTSHLRAVHGTGIKEVRKQGHNV